MQAAWESRDTNGRINIVLSEQLISKSSSMEEPDLGLANDIVCFSFQHAPKGAWVPVRPWTNLSSTDILEQVGISWPIRNPLYLPNVHEGSFMSSKSTDTSSRGTRVRNDTENTHMHSPLSQVTSSNFMRPRGPEPLRRPSSHPPPLSHFPKPPLGGRGNGHPDIWHDSFRAYRDSHDDESQSSWSTQRSASNTTSTGDMFSGSCKLPSSRRFQPVFPLATPPTIFQDVTQPEWTTSRQRRDQDSSLGLNLQDEHLGQTIQAPSPPKRHRDLPHGMGGQPHEHLRCPPSVHAYLPPKMGNIAPTSRPSAAALARKSSYPDLADAMRNAPRNPSPDKSSATDFPRNKPVPTYQPSVSSNKENRISMPTECPHPTPTTHGSHTGTQMSLCATGLRSSRASIGTTQVKCRVHRMEHLMLHHLREASEAKKKGPCKTYPDTIKTCPRLLPETQQTPRPKPLKSSTLTPSTPLTLSWIPTLPST
jgi:hypothetical protein